MKLIGATNFMIRTPFVVEGILIGFMGAVIPLAIIYFLYRKVLLYMQTQITAMSASGVSAGIFALIPASRLFPGLSLACIIFGVVLGAFVSFLTVRKLIRV